MSHLIVVNQSAKTVKIATTPNKYLTEVRDEACAKFGVDKDAFTLKYKDKPVPLSQQIRLANLPQAARLELVQASRSPTVISVGLQLPETEKHVRLTKKFPSNTSLWEVLRQFESTENVNYNFTQRGVPEIETAGQSFGAGRLNYEQPILTVMPGHKVEADFVGLQKTLGQLGFDSGSALMKLSYKNSGMPLEEAMTTISQYFRGTEEVEAAQASSSVGHTRDSVESIPPWARPSDAEVQPEVQPGDAQPLATLLATLNNTRPEGHLDETSRPKVVFAVPTMDGKYYTATDDCNAFLQAMSAPTSPARASQFDPLPNPETARNVQIYSPPESATPQAALRGFNDSDYEPTIEHAKSHQAALQAKSRNQRLLSDKELADLEAARLEKINAVAAKGSKVRIRMPDQFIIQFDVTKEDTAATLYKFFEHAEFLEFKEPFQLRYVGPNGRPVILARDDKRLIQDLRFTAAELLTFLWGGDASDAAKQADKALSSEWAAKAQTLKVEEPVVNENPQASFGGPRVIIHPDGKKKDLNPADKESKLKSILGKGLFKR